MASRRIGIRNKRVGVKVREYYHFTECLVAMFPEHKDEECTCWDESPDWD